MTKFNELVVGIHEYLEKYNLVNSSVTFVNCTIPNLAQRHMPDNYDRFAFPAPRICSASAKALRVATNLLQVGYLHHPMPTKVKLTNLLHAECGTEDEARSLKTLVMLSKHYGERELRIPRKIQEMLRERKNRPLPVTDVNPFDDQPETPCVGGAGQAAGELR